MAAMASIARMYCMCDLVLFRSVGSMQRQGFYSSQRAYNLLNY